MVTNLVHLLLQTISFPKPKRGKQHLLQMMLVEQLRMSFDKVQNQQCFQNLSTQKLCLRSSFTLCLRSSLRKTICQWINHKEAIVYGGSWKPVGDEKFKVFLVVIILIGVCKSNNESVEQL